MQHCSERLLPSDGNLGIAVAACTEGQFNSMPCGNSPYCIAMQLISLSRSPTPCLKQAWHIARPEVNIRVEELLQVQDDEDKFIEQSQQVIDTLQHSCSLVMRHATQKFNIGITWGIHSEWLGIPKCLAFHQLLVEALAAKIKIAICDV